MTVRELRVEDRAAVQDALITCGTFTEEEVRVALEMVDAGLNGDYSLLAVEQDGEVRGYACAGRAHLTSSSWYLYWICVHRRAQGAGLGRMLQAHIEDLIRALGGDRLVLETSGRADYVRSRRFYRTAGFIEVGRIPDFYKAGDDCLIYCKVLTGGATR
ncbi:MAG TPA: N-acetyltransferase [Steroidobacteraceae bacterium]